LITTSGVEKVEEGVEVGVLLSGIGGVEVGVDVDVGAPSGMGRVEVGVEVGESSGKSGRGSVDVEIGVEVGVEVGELSGIGKVEVGVEVGESLDGGKTVGTLIGEVSDVAEPPLPEPPPIYV
jgi:hypothetical protein